MVLGNFKRLEIRASCDVAIRRTATEARFGMPKGWMQQSVFTSNYGFQALVCKDFSILCCIYLYKRALDGLPVHLLFQLADLGLLTYGVGFP